MITLRKSKGDFEGGYFILDFTETEVKWLWIK